MAPAQKRLQRTHISIFDGNDRLVFEIELPVHETAREIPFELEPVLHFARETFIVKGMRRTEDLLGAIEGEISPLQNCCNIPIVRQDQRCTDAHPGHHAAMLQLESGGERVFDRKADELRHRTANYMGQDRRELVSPEPKQEGSLARSLTQPISHSDQQCVASRMSQRVVNVLEAV